MKSQILLAFSLTGCRLCESLFGSGAKSCEADDAGKWLR
jgi:hypothetical protein